MTEPKFTPIPSFTEKQKAKFWKRVQIKTPQECWEWHGGLMSKKYPYGRISRLIDGAKLNFRVHRVVYFLDTGRDPKELRVCHSCDNPCCCNPAHLFLGTDAENVRDKIAKGRNTKGDLVKTARLKNEQILPIRKDYATGRFTQKELGEAYNVPENIIGQVVRGKTWRFIEVVEMQPGVKKKLSNTQFGELNYNAKLTAESVRQIREMHSSGVRLSVIAVRFGVTKENVDMVVKRKTWKHVNP